MWPVGETRTVIVMSISSLFYYEYVYVFIYLSIYLPIYHLSLLSFVSYYIIPQYKMYWFYITVFKLQDIKEKSKNHSMISTYLLGKTLVCVLPECKIVVTLGVFICRLNTV